MENALSNLKTKFNQLSQIRNLLSSYKLYYSELYVDPGDISYVISVMGDDWTQPFSAVGVGFDSERGAENEHSFAGVCIVGLKSGVEYVVGHAAHVIDDYMHARQNKKMAVHSTGQAPMSDKINRGAQISLDDLGEVLKDMEGVSGPLMNLTLLSIGCPKNG
jgi:hypothetical protein